MLKHRRVLCAALGLLALGVFFAGCGKKGDPIPPKMTLPPVVADLGAASIAEGIALGWSVSGPMERIDAFRIVRSEADPGASCAGCPQEYRPFLTLKTTDPGLKHEGEKGFRYIDASVTAGRHYSYRVAACDSRGQCSEPSAPISCPREMR